MQRRYNDHKYILYFAIAILTENINLNIPINNDKENIIEGVKKNINLIYKQIKQNEVKPSTEYLFNNVKEDNLEKSLLKINQMNQIGYIPRN